MPRPERIRVLLAEDVAADAELELRELKRAGLAVVHRTVDSEPAFIAALEEFEPDVILSDFSMQGFDGMAALSVARARRPGIPFIFVSGTIGEEYAIRALKNGATDYVLKSNLMRLPAAVERAVQEVAERAVRRRAEAELEAARERLTSIFLSVDDVLWSLALPEERLLYLSPAAARVYGREANEFIENARLWLEVVPAEDRGVLLAARRAARGGKPHEIEIRIVRPDGELRWINVRARLVRDERGTQRIDGISRDVTERRRAADALRGSEERYRLLADMIPQNIWTTDAEGHHNYFSRRWYKYSGATPEESLGEGWLEFIHPDDRERTLARWRRSLETGEPYEIEYRFRGTDGVYRWFLGKALPLRNTSGHIVEWFGTATDISERKRLDEERLAAARLVVHDAPHAALHLGADRHHVPPVAQRDQRLLEGRAELGRVDELLEARAQAVVRHAHGATQRSEARRRGVEQPAGRVEAPLERGAQRRQRRDLAAQTPQKRPARPLESRAEVTRGDQRVEDALEGLRLQPAPPFRARDRRPDVVRPGDAGRLVTLEEVARLVGLVQPTRHDVRVVGGRDRLGEATARLEAGVLGQPGADRRELEDRERAIVHRPMLAAGQRETDGCPARVNRHGSETHGSPA